MNQTADRLAQRRVALVDRARAQRADLLAQLEGLARPARSVERGARLLQSIRSHPLVAVAIAAVVLLYRPRRTLKWIGRAVTLYSFGRKLFAAFAQR